jgi:hypothetical protein
MGEGSILQTRQFDDLASFGFGGAVTIFGINLINDLCDYFGTTLTATALR